MTFEEFVAQMRELLEEYISEDPQLSIYTALKNNGCERKGITFLKRDDNVSPTIYLEEYYERFVQGQKIELLAREIVELYDSIKEHDAIEGSYFQDFENIKDHIIFKLVNTKKNEKLLSHVPFESFLDLSMVYMVLVEMNDNGSQIATMQIREEHLEWWGIGEKELYERALFNTPRLMPHEMCSMFDMMLQLICDSKPEGEADYLEEDSMYVLSNSSRTCGASVICYPGLLNIIYYNLGENYYVIPSSIHEVIIIPESSALPGIEMKHLVQEVNKEFVCEEEILSDHVYYYDRRVGNIRIEE